MINRYGTTLTLKSPERVIDCSFPKNETFTIHKFAKEFELKKNLLYKYLRKIGYIDELKCPSDKVINSGIFMRCEGSYVINNGVWVAIQYKPLLTNKGVKHLVKVIASRAEVMSELQK